MKKIKILFGLLLINCVCLSAQKNIFIDVESSISFISQSQIENTRDFDTHGERLLNFNTIETVRLNLTVSTARAYRRSLGYGFSANANIKIGNKLFLRTGVGADYRNITSNWNHLNSTTSLVSIDTTIFIGMPAVMGCQDPEYPAITPIDRREHFDFITLRIPFEFTFQVLDSKISFGFGGYAQGIIYNRLQTENLMVTTVPTTTFPPTFDCDYHVVPVELNVRNSLETLSFGYSMNIGYEVLPNLSLHLSLLQDLTNTFIDADATSSSELVNHFIPKRIILGMRYAFKR